MSESGVVQMSNEQLQSECYSAAHAFAKSCYSFKEAKAPRDAAPLDDAMTFLITELWDWTFSQAEITQAFQTALAGMDQYAAGQERRI